MASLKAFITSICLGLAAQNGFALSEPLPPPPTGTLFASDRTIEIEIEAPLAELFYNHDFAAHEDVKNSVMGTLSYVVEGRRVSIPAKFKVKGNSTANACEFKKVELKFKDKDTVNTLFSTIKSIDLNTHCQEKPDREDPYSASYFNHREAVLYKMAQTLGLATYETRPVFVRYKNTGTLADNPHKMYQAFFVEDKSDFLSRLNAQEFMGRQDRNYAKDKKKDSSKADAQYIIDDIRTHSEIDLEDLYRILLFNVLIQNNDWGLPFNEGPQTSLWNVKIISMTPGRWIPVTQDFGLAAPVTGTPYPHQIIDGYKLADDETIRRIENTFVEKRAELYEMLKLLSNDPEGQQFLKQCLDQFFEGARGRTKH